jgi:hypothetical protein
MEDLLRALMQGSQQQSRPEGAGPDDDPLAQLLQGLMGGQAPQDSAAQAEPDPIQGEIDMGSLLQGILGGTGGLAGGAGQVPAEHGVQAETGPVQGSPDLGGLLQGILGGTGGLAAGTDQAPTSGAGQFGDILGAIMGGGSPTLESDSFLAPIVTGLAEKLGLPPQVAQTVVAFVLGKLMARRLQPGVEAFPPPTRSRTVQPEATSMENVVQRMSSGKRVTKAEIRDAGLAKELAAHTGLDGATAEASLHEVLNALGDQLGAEK